MTTDGTVSNTAAATTHAVGGDRCKRQLSGALITLTSNSGVDTFTCFDFAQMAEDGKKYWREALAVSDGNGAPKPAEGGPAATPAAETSVVDISQDPDPPANSAKDKKADTMLALERYKTTIMTHYDKIQENTIITLMTFVVWPL
jgi:hypothetical protein